MEQRERGAGDGIRQRVQGQNRLDVFVFKEMLNLNIGALLRHVAFPPHHCNPSRKHASPSILLFFGSRFSAHFVG